MTSEKALAELQKEFKKQCPDSMIRSEYILNRIESLQAQVTKPQAEGLVEGLHGFTDILPQKYRCPKCHTKFTRFYPYRPADTKECHDSPATQDGIVKDLKELISRKPKCGCHDFWQLNIQEIIRKCEAK